MKELLCMTVACLTQNVDLAKLLINEGYKIKDTWDYLEIACKTKDLKMVSLLLQHGSTITFTCIAESLSHPDLIDLLISYGADANAPYGNAWFFTTFFKSCFFSERNVKPLIEKYKYKIKPEDIIYVAESNDADFVIFLLEHVPRDNHVFSEKLKHDLFLRHKDCLPVQFEAYQVLNDREWYLGRDKKGLIVSLLIGRELSRSCPFHKDMFPLDMFKLIFKFSHLFNFSR